MPSLPTLDHIPTPYEADRIAALPDVVTRNLQITQCYHELAVAMAVRTGTSANWCSFATWASKQAGQTIRKEDFARTLEDVLRRSPAAQDAMPDLTASAQALGSDQSQEEIQESVLDLLSPLAPFNRASAAVGEGNRKVFAEIGREFARFFALCLNDAAYDAVKIAQFCEGLRPGDPPDGQGFLRQAFTHYYLAFFETDPKTRAELIHLANIEIGFHEQTRLQPEIAGALGAAFLDRREFRTRLIKALFPNRGWLARVRLFVLRLFDRPSPFDAGIDALYNEARRRANLLITEYLMSISFPGSGRLRLGEDMPGQFPPLLQQITYPDLRAMLEKVDPTPDSVKESGAVDWSNLPDRLHFIIELFRCYHQHERLFEPPFTPDQVTALKAGRLPEGRL